MTPTDDTNREKTPENPTTVEAAQSVSQVAAEPSPLKKYALHGGVAVIVAVVIGSMLFSGHKKPEKTEANSNLSNSQDYAAELQANLAKLKQSTEQARQQLSDYQNQMQQTQQHQQSQRALLARQNAPTSMYAASASTASTTATTESPTFAGRGVYAQFGNQVSQTATVSATRIAHPDYTIASGEFLHAVLETAINSNLPGMVRAVVTQPVYAYTGQTPLIPAGSRLIGQYSAATFQGVNRVFILWNRVILPNGISVQINSPGTDAIGRAGQGADDVNTHFLARFGQASLLSIIGAGVATVGVDSQDQFNSAADYRSAIASSFQQSANASLQSSGQIKPTLSIHQGAAINVFVARDLDFYRVLQRQSGRVASSTSNGLLPAPLTDYKALGS